MKKHLLILLSLCSSMLANSATWGDSLTVDVSASVQNSPPQITLSWSTDADAVDFKVYRKLKGATSWGAVMATLPANATGYTDNTVALNIAYDYRVSMTATAGGPTKHGYVASSIELKPVTNRGIVIAVIEDTYLANVNYENAINQYVKDLEYDGWFVKTLYVNQANTVASVKAQIVSKYNENPANTKMVSLLGHVPVPYSGELNPDGHGDHIGAWPTDTYYADMDGTWADITVNNISSSNTKNHNIPGDGKFDHSLIPSNVDVQIGRIDFFNMPAFAASEEELMIRYLNKAHAFKAGQLNVSDRGLISDNFTSYAEGFSQNGYRNFAPLVGPANVYTNTYFTELSYTTSSTGTYKWSYGCGGGTYTSAGGIGSTTTFAGDSLSSIFTMLFGSYFGDWDYTNAFLRAPLAQGNTLTNCWAGRPNWHFYHMGIGDNIGYAAQLTTNNNGLFFGSTLAGLNRLVSINLMGDPSLRMHYMRPPSNLTAVNTNGNGTLAWTASPDAVLGYNVYRRYTDSTTYVKLNSSIISTTNFTDNTLPVAGDVIYYVKAVALQTTPSGTYYNETLAISDTAFINVGIGEELLEKQILVYPNPANQQFTLRITKTGFNNAVLHLTDVSGKLLLNETLTVSEKTFDVTSLLSGMYLLRVETDGKTVYRKLVID